MIPLLHRGSEIGSAQWSPDNRIAVTTPECIYILTEALPDVGVPPYTPEYCATSRDQRVRRFLDPLFFSSTTATHDLLRASSWSPAGCTWLGGCLLASVTTSGRVLVFTPPSGMETRWKQVVDLTKEACTLLNGCNYNIMELNSRSTGLPSNISEKQSEEVFYARRLMVAFTCCQWFSLLIGAVAVVAVATRSGHLMVWSIDAPIIPGGRLSVLSVMDVAGGQDTWVCSMCWCVCDNEVCLFLGCTNGSVFLARWGSSHDLLAGKMSSEGLIEIWRTDDIGVHQIAWQPADQTLAVSKGCTLVVLSVPSPSSLSSVPDYTYCSGLHTLPISGLCALAFGGFLTSSLDGTVRKCWVAPQGRCTSAAVTLEPLQFGCPYSAYGITTSSGSVFAAVVLRPNLDLAIKSTKSQSYVQFVGLADDSHVMRCLAEKGYQWDTGEYITQFYLTHGNLPSFVSLAHGSARLRRHLELTTGSDATVTSTALQYMCVLSSLRHWVDWKEEGGVAEGTRGTASLYHMVRFVQSNKNVTQEELCLAHKVSDMLSKAPRLHGESCPICGDALGDICSTQCDRGHPLQRCSVTLCVCGETDARRCIHCGSPSLGIAATQQDPWLSHLLSRNTLCIYCGGSFEQLLG